ncbi:hypothetical protein OESDEN_18900 [Oesophagostomum dentatum]|uniref:Uncharacterized protein n=1 Tax=Oesophagostomum dentatum TaxID=61180 RepID=A0A0B1S8Z4_OESDE|nr:hypothetical protein OESDEN_18900 [Oesophagostomum dentatum]
METKISTFTAVVFLTSTTFIAIWLNRFFEFGSEKEEEEAAMQLLRLYPIRQIATLCSTTSSDCFVISDRMENVQGTILPLRAIRKKGVAMLALSDARLYIPKPMSFKTLDTRRWKVNRNYVYLVYARTMASGVFFSQAVNYSSAEESSILMMGLGGGIISGYLGSRPHKKVRKRKKKNTAG